MNKYERNIQQIRDRGESAEIYYSRGGINECSELGDVFIQAEKDLVEFGKVLDSTKKMFYDEIPDVLNEIDYAIKLFDLDRNKIDSIRNYKLDRGYERGKDNEKI